MDPQLINHPEQATSIYKELVRERYLVSKHTNTSYTDVANLTPLERRYILEFITDDVEKQNAAYEKAKAEADERR